MSVIKQNKINPSTSKFKISALNQITVFGNTGAPVKAAVAQISAVTSRVSGELIIPEGKSGVLIGKGGAHITPIRGATGCSAQNRGNGNLWAIDGSSIAAVNEFIRLAKALMEKEHVVGTTGRLVKPIEPIVVHDRTRAAAKKTTKPKSGAKKPVTRLSVVVNPDRKTTASKPAAQKPSAAREEKNLRCCRGFSGFLSRVESKLLYSE